MNDEHMMFLKVDMLQRQVDDLTRLVQRLVDELIPPESEHDAQARKTCEEAGFRWTPSTKRCEREGPRG